MASVFLGFESGGAGTPILGQNRPPSAALKEISMPRRVRNVRFGKTHNGESPFISDWVTFSDDWVLDSGTAIRDCEWGLRQEMILRVVSNRKARASDSIQTPRDQCSRTLSTPSRKLDRFESFQTHLERF